MIKPTILEKYEALPDFLKTEVDCYIDSLLEKYVENKMPSGQAAVEEISENSYGYGSLAGKIIMSDDFDEPLEELREYM
jgi:hypothetical protein